ncbi:MAG: type II toxin-antitoxin system RelE/ParE family toxin [Thermomicrobiales bacterium]|nr:type II toxin-antitoxin system RelE/ParE family toxin [Thermomicrobiales bacterium]
MSQRALEFVGRSKRDLEKFPEEVQELVAFALLEAMDGHKHQDAEPLRGFGGAGVLAVHDSFRTDTYRVIYTIDFPGMVYVLHAFKKKSTRGDETPRPDMELIRQRYKSAREIHARRERT